MQAVVKHKIYSTNDIVLMVLGLIGFLITAYFLFIFKFDVGVPAGAVLVGTLETQSFVRRRHGRTLEWRNIHQQDSLYLRDMIYVPANSLGTKITFQDGKFLELEPDSMIQLDSIDSDGMMIRLFSGGVRGKSQVKVQQVVEKVRLVPYPKSLKQLAPLDELDQLERLKRILLERSEIALLAKPKLDSVDEKRIPSFRLSKLSDFVLRLIFPEKENYNYRAHRWLEMKWTGIPIDGVTYRLVVSRYIDFQKGLEYRSKSDLLSVQLDQAGDYHWKVIAENSSRSENLSSEASRFKMSLRGGKGGEIKIRRPGGTGMGYSFEIASDESMRKIISRGKTAINRCPTSTLKTGTYYCRVVSIDDKTDSQTYTVNQK